jgi:hypothetical protein
MLGSQFSAISANFRRTKLASFSKTNVLITFFQKLAAALAKKRPYFRQIFQRKIFKKS